MKLHRIIPVLNLLLAVLASPVLLFVAISDSEWWFKAIGAAFILLFLGWLVRGAWRYKQVYDITDYDDTENDPEKL